MRKEIQIETNDEHIIYGTFDSIKESKTLLIFVHGFTGHKNEHHYFNAASYFIERGFGTFRFNFYGDGLNARSLSKISLKEHFSDLKLVINTFKSKYDDIILIGHSLGCVVILNTDLSDISKIVLWDPSSKLKDLKAKNFDYNSSLDKYIYNSRLSVIVSKELINEWQTVDIGELAEKINVPCKFVFAGNCNKLEIWKPFLSRIKVANEYAIVEGASHVFIEEGVEQKLFEETLNYIKV
ncbi:MAG: alpha/beta fold hydrolase [Candidatus Paceibacterota bacterium]|jgi:alpha-beta hydrolase superfamily lysophospholipase